MNRQKDLMDLFRMYRTHSKIWATEWSRNNADGISVSEALVLEVLGTKGAQKASSLASELGITTGGITGIADKMVKAGLIRRLKDELDRRVVYLHITELGSNVLGTLDEKILNQMERLFGMLTDSDIQELLRIYDKLIHYDQPSDNEQ
ncbi:MarR family winged helix-turn-helix transcriptional regulator [Ferviditalea candida]|uniref:MarR family transcriptional regulator n=1 Tax=Ferviditalea candida TaxID=3108399 RepID=A0ABU5ZJP8_9BACL|nr:MarR family transcriptional regulator [Paenibacillaceae bacterium T2]